MGKSKRSETESAESVQDVKVNLDDYAGDAEDDQAAKKQSGKYMNDLEGNENEDQGEEHEQ
jgi:hypothetical protein